MEAEKNLTLTEEKNAIEGEKEELAERLAEKEMIANQLEQSTVQDM
eukprot:CAMPEP_0202966294 /NCGR_PEP_ID=MMETSP1396-20130829/10647_1 /ASSEMBLY_ACC=CAM_ASM_000872 /TAXON_ID= /ORGANISM="Pseudokeronopsis sp., Strain Brazil" /LENGTH=45 /DNA_ID= /DNA_START= /DNA_END= /DNA_ORIENTATION=